MAEDISIEKAKDIISSAFQPFRCTVKVYDHDDKVEFRVVRDAGFTIVHFKDISVGQVTDSQRLLSLLEWARSRAESQVATLDPWEFPQID